jgi:hypothetical protein
MRGFFVSGVLVFQMIFASIKQRKCPQSVHIDFQRHEVIRRHKLEIDKPNLNFRMAQPINTIEKYMSPLLPFPLPKKKALEIIRELSEVSERIFYSPHAKARMIERGVNMPDVMDCLGKGQITEGPFQQPGGDWRFTISWFKAGSPLQVVGAIDIDDDGTFLVIVTTIQKKG